MIGQYAGQIEGALTAIIVLGFCAYQYWVTNRSIEKDKALARDAGHAEGEHQLDNGRDEPVH